MEIPERLSASKEGTFAYYTVKDRLPSILVGVIDTLHKLKTTLESKHGKEGLTDLKEVVGRLSKMRYEMMTNKQLNYIEDSQADTNIYNAYYDEMTTLHGTPTWFTAPWLYVECYMYRQIMSSLHQSVYLTQFDPFKVSKEKSFQQSLDAIRAVVDHMSSALSSVKEDNVKELKSLIKEFTELALWGNKCDLSISVGRDNSQTTNPLRQVGKLEEYLLADDYDTLWDYLLLLRSSDKPNRRVDVILDNAGFELMCDLCLAEVLLRLGFTDKVVFHVKTQPWFVSDTTLEDVHYAISELQDCQLHLQREMGDGWVRRGYEGSFVLESKNYWTLPFDYSEMRSRSPSLYEELSKSDLLIFKGDLNYRKLLGDREWSPEGASFNQSLLMFNPAPILALRTLKAEVCSGLPAGTVSRAAARHKDWMTSGQYGVIQFSQCVHPLQLAETEVAACQYKPARRNSKVRFLDSQ